MSRDGEQSTSGLPRVRAMGERIAPIYRRLPSGPHQLDPREISIHQRLRIQGAMVEVVARGGYEEVTVRRVVGFAGVSRRSFYEQFANRHDCFLKTVNAVARDELARARGACLGEDAPDAALAAALASIAADVHKRPDALRLWLCEPLSAGDTGAVALGEALTAAERMLGEALARDGGTMLPAGILRALSGALHGTLCSALRREARPAAAPLAGQLAALALAQRVPGNMSEELRSQLRESVRRAALAAAARASTGVVRADARERMRQSVMRLAATQPVGSLSVAEIADGAGVSVEAFFDSFGGTAECLSEALVGSGERLLEITARAHEAGGDWSQGVRLALAGALGHLSANAASARALALVAHRAGAAARLQSAELDAALGSALLYDAPAGATSPAAASGALWHTVRQSLLESRLHLLPALSDQLAYALLAPALGSDAAMGALRERC